MQYLFVRGVLRSRRLSTGEGTHTLSDSLPMGRFLLKLDNSGNFKWAKNLQNKRGNWYSMSVDKFGYTYIIGSFSDTLDFDPSLGVFKLTSSGLSDGFISKFDTFGNLSWAMKVGGNSPVDINYSFESFGFSITTESGYAITIDDLGKIHMIGTFIDSVDFNQSTMANALKSTSFFLLKLSQSNFSDVEENPEQANSLSIYPNPSSSSITVNFGKQITKRKNKTHQSIGANYI